MTNHNRTYHFLLVALALFSAASAVAAFTIARLPAGETIAARLPQWSLPWVAALNLAYAIAILLILGLRHRRAASAARLTRALNWALLLAFPGRTLVGIHGLWRADKAA